MTESEAELTGAEKHYPRQPSLLDAEIYRDPHRYRQELEHILQRSWFPVAPSSGMPEPHGSNTAESRLTAFHDEIAKRLVGTSRSD